MRRNSLRIVRNLLLLLSCVSLYACSPAKYRGWNGGDQYFNDQDRMFGQEDRISPRSQSGSSGCSSPYVVRSGDTLSIIADRCGVDMMKLADANGLHPPYTLYIKQELVLPRKVTKAPLVHDFSKSEHKAPKMDSTSGFGWPLSKPYNYQFLSDSAGNNALVIKAPVGEAVYAAEQGEVVYSGSGIEHYGRLIIIKHDDGYLTIYAHNDSLLVKEGQEVKKGALIATVGVTGDVQEPQLFFEARYHGRKVDAKPLFHQKFLH